jgi:HNH endonuclease
MAGRSKVTPKRPPKEGELVCSRCRWPKPATREHFHYFSRGRHQCNAFCKVCHQELDRERYERKRDEFALRSKAYTREHPDRKRASSQKRRDAVARSPDRLTKEQDAVLRSYFGECVGCGAVSDPMVLDHVISLDSGGSDAAHNRALLCATCNKKKRARYLEFRQRWYERRKKAGRHPGLPPFPWPGFKE